jgi:hypothetical protein
MAVVYDTLRYFCTFEEGVFREGYDGFRIEESDDGREFVVYMELNDQPQEKRFILPESFTPYFMELERRYRTDFLAKQRYLFDAVVEIERLWQESSNRDLREITDLFYMEPINYVHFVAMNMTKSQFYFYAQSRIQLAISC